MSSINLPFIDSLIIIKVEFTQFINLFPSYLCRLMLTQSFIQEVAQVALTFKALGIVPANQCMLPQVLKSMSPNGSTVLRDAVIEGSVLMLKLFQLIANTRLVDEFHFVMIVLTDGEDAGSKRSMAQVLQSLMMIKQVIPVKMLKIFFIGVDIDSRAERELRAMSEAGGQNADYMNISSGDISNVFQRISVGLGLQKRQQLFAAMNQQGEAYIKYNEQYIPYLHLTQNKYIVLFNLDMSGSMSGNKWNKLCVGTQCLIDSLGDEDFVGGMVFNSQCTLLRIDAADQKPSYQPPQPSYRAPQQNNYNPVPQNNYNPPQANYQPIANPGYGPQPMSTRNRIVIGLLIIFGLVVIILLIAAVAK